MLRRIVGGLGLLALGCAGTGSRDATEIPPSAPGSVAASDPEPEEVRGVETVPPTEYDAQTEARIARIVADLRVPGVEPGTWSEPYTLDEIMERLRLPGVSVALIDEGKIAWARGFGVRRAGEDTRVDARTRFQAGSISKPVFATAVMRMAASGKLDIDADVNGYLESWKVPPVGDWQPKITLRNLLTHSAGLTVHGFPGYPADAKLPTVPQVLSGEAPSNTPPVMVDILPGLQPRYSGGGTTVGQLAVSEHLGAPFPALMKEWVLGPFGMEDSAYAQPLDEASKAWAASAHSWGGKPIDGDAHVYPEMAAAGLWTTPTDLARFGLGIAASLRGDAGAPLAKAQAQAMLTPQTAPHMGIGFFLQAGPGSSRFSHGGRDEGFDAQLILDRDGRQGAVIMINANRDEVPQLLLWAIAREYGWADMAPPVPEAVDVPAKTLRAYVGRYEVRPGYVLELRMAGERLELLAPGQPPLRLRGLGEGRLAVEGLAVTLRVEAGADGGAPRSITIDQGRGPVPARRL